MLLTEESLQRLPALPLENKEFLPETSGLYFVTAIATERRLLYIGQTQNFRKRFESHHRFRDFYIASLAGTKVYITWLEILAPEEFLLREERELIWALKPVLNDQQFRNLTSTPPITARVLQSNSELDQPLSRSRAMELLGIGSPTTWTRWCNAVGVVSGKPLFTNEDIQKLTAIKSARDAGLRSWGEILNHVSENTNVSVVSDVDETDSFVDVDSEGGEEYD